MFNVAYRWLWDRADAADVVQETFLRLWRMREQVRVDTVDALAFRVAVNLAANRRRSRKLWGFVPFSGREQSGRDVEKDVAARERDARVRRAIEALPILMRRVVVMTEMSGLSHAEVAATLQFPVGTVVFRRSLAMARLRGTLADVDLAHA